MRELQPSNLALFWAAVIAVSILVYVVLDGLDLGVGILFGSTRDEGHRSQMMSTIAPFWDGNETWLVVIGAGLFASFPVVYAVFMGAFYVPLLLLLVGLIFRGIAFEFRYRSVRARRLWDAGFFLGSTVVAFAQGAAVGALMRGIPVSNEQFAGTSFDWLHPFAVLTGIGLVFGYALLGAGWIVLKSEGPLRDWAYKRIGWLAAIVFVLLGLAFTVSLTVDVGAVAQSHLRDRAWGLVFPVAAIAALGSAVMSARARRDGLTFALTVLFVLVSYLTLGVMFWPYMVPYAITVGEAAAPEASLSFLFYGGVVVLPVIALYTAGVYWVFRGKVQHEPE
ncbi:cytochrome d ubiquinol oxidase subunit II [Paraburkholderia hospita]|jgi:cytochrome d ubiquinol oxidase subunit II|uniref:cytochrome d ubiquinol oxidase subunit II n=1 Tax=Paraburkholderia hospita TaxID=169430 RepID=UPI000271ADAC|nr:cytochrome d ubiquinol oxidase subunit II [Paraburkholderia hospita]EUC11568.1 cytochrome d ubiquinol oxidase, subunit II [Burkholderia sp. BT03]SKD07749.1 cytochrome bd-I ubiquinol oxidase subunit 2 apoprotein [Paraburkholderia hospita]